MYEIEISTEYIKLDQFLKYVGIAENGAHAKLMIQADMVLVNGQVENRRGTKLRPGDRVGFEEDEYLIK